MFKLINKMLIGVVALGLIQSVSAYTISPTGSTSGGNPGGIADYQVSLDAADQGSSFNVLWGYTSSTDQVSAIGTFTISKYDATNGLFDLSFSLTNTSTVTATSNPRLMSFGLNITPDLTLDSVDFGSGNQLDQYSTGTNFPGFQTIDFCVYSAGCTGGNINTGLASGDTDTFVAHFSLAGGLPDSLTLADFAAKFQGVDSYELPGMPCQPGTPCSPPSKVPEPGTVLLFGIGLLGLGASRKLKK